jgi:hypothetical protein
MKLQELQEDYSQPSLEEFITSSMRNSWVTFTSSKGYTLESYVRKGPRFLDGQKYDKVLDRANTSLKDEEVVLKMMDQNEYMAGTGAYKEFDQLMISLAKQYEFDAIFVENILNPQLPGVLARWGYTRTGDPNTPSFYKLL